MNEVFRKYLEEAIGSDNALVAFSAFQNPATVSVRLNPFKKGCSFEGRRVPWNSHGILLEERPLFTLDPMFHAGAYYVQDSSSMFVGHLFRKVLAGIEIPKDRPLRVLDLCAAPGGKTTDLVASLREACGNNFVLVANEVMKARVGILADNVALWGDPNVVVTSDDPRSFSMFAGFFDIVLADVPCSGEGMFRKDEQAMKQWSEDNVALCEARQRRILADVWPALSTGGILIYSTCTFNVYENDGNVRWAAGQLGATILPDEMEENGVIRTGCGYSLVPGFVDGEGQYCAALKKTSVAEPMLMRSSKAVGACNMPCLTGLDHLFLTDMRFSTKGDTITAVPSAIAAETEVLRRNLHVVAAGCAVGVRKGDVLVPDADMALSIMFDKSVYPMADVDLRTALAFLHRDAIILSDVEKGYVSICYKGLPLGFVKNLGNRCNSLHPQSRRIRMNIPNELL